MATESTNQEGELEQKINEWIDELIGWNYGTVYKLFDTEETAETLEADTKERAVKLKTLVFQARQEAEVAGYERGLQETLALKYKPHDTGYEFILALQVQDLLDALRPPQSGEKE